MTEHMNSGPPSLSEQERARRAVVNTLEAAAGLLLAEGNDPIVLKPDHTEAEYQFALGVKAGMRLAGKRLTHHTVQARMKVLS